MILLQLTLLAHIAPQNILPIPIFILLIFLVKMYSFLTEEANKRPENYDAPTDIYMMQTFMVINALCVHLNLINEVE